MKAAWLSVHSAGLRSTYVTMHNFSELNIQTHKPVFLLCFQIFSAFKNIIKGLHYFGLDPCWSALSVSHFQYAYISHYPEGKKNDATHVCFVLPFARPFPKYIKSWHLGECVYVCVCACKLAGFFFSPNKTMLCKNFAISRPNLSFHLFHRCLTVLIKNFWHPIGHLTNV